MMRIPPLLAFGAFMLVALTGPSVQADPPDALLEDIEVNGEPMPVESVRDTPLPDIYHVRLENGETFYSDSEGKHFLVGDLYRNGEDGLVNLSEQGRNEERAARIATVPESERVIFRGVHDTKARVTVFTDATCPYCRKFHEEVPRLNEMGIAVHYLAFPRGGLSSEGGRELRQIWCADNRTEAMNAAKRDEALPDTEDCDNPVEDQYHLGMDIGVEGTPAIVLPDGRLVPGYVPAERLADMLGVSG